MALRLIESGEYIVFDDKTELILGRVHDGDIPDIDLEPHDGKKAGVSRRHGRITLQEGQWYIEDLNSTNGTFVNGIQLAPNEPTPINSGDYLRLGTMELQFGSDL
ncbi:MAG: FHA domain-containing protein [Anaerolineae bacterium]|nr:FHA domain-containing protein [Anaerolineae bacterium]